MVKPAEKLITIGSNNSYSVLAFETEDYKSKSLKGLDSWYKTYRLNFSFNTLDKT